MLYLPYYDTSSYFPNVVRRGGNSNVVAIILDYRGNAHSFCLEYLCQRGKENSRLTKRKPAICYFSFSNLTWHLECIRDYNLRHFCHNWMMFNVPGIRLRAFYIDFMFCRCGGFIISLVSNPGAFLLIKCLMGGIMTSDLLYLNIVHTRRGK